MRGRRHVWAIAGGGTGGHVTPALALAECVAARGDALFVLGGRAGLEQRLVPQAGFELVTLPTGQIMGRGVGVRLGSGLAMARGVLGAWRALGRHRADLLVSVGGYASVPGVLAAALRRLPIASVEPNARPGRSNRAAARFARAAFLQFDDAATELARAREVHVVGAPLRRGLVAAFRAAPPRRWASPPLRVLVFGGSQGARQINEAMIEAAPRLGRDPASYEIFHQAGEADRARVASAYADAGLAARVVAFENDMPTRYAEADVAVCRSGALTVAELAMAALPSLLVPYPYAADDHQAANARAMACAGAARVLASRPLDAAELVRELERVVRDEEALPAMSAAAAGLARPDAAEQVVERCAAWLGEDAA